MSVLSPSSLVRSGTAWRTGTRASGLTCWAYGYFSGGRSRSADASTADRSYTGCTPAQCSCERFEFGSELDCIPNCVPRSPGPRWDQGLRASFGYLHSWSALGRNRSCREPSSIAVSVRRGCGWGGAPPVPFLFPSVCCQCGRWFLGGRRPAKNIVPLPPVLASLLDGGSLGLCGCTRACPSLPVRGSRQVRGGEIILIDCRHRIAVGGSAPPDPGVRLGRVCIPFSWCLRTWVDE